MSKTKTTLKDIAERANVSIATVSRALRDDARVAESTRRYIMQIAQEMGVSLQSELTNAVGPVVVHVLDTGWGSFFEESIHELTRYGEEHNFEVIIERVRRHEPVSGAIAKARDMKEGVVVLGTWDNINETEAEQIGNLNVPVILINRYIGTRAASVTLDDFATGWTVVEYLTNLGHERIAYLPGVQSSTSMQDRLRGYRAALERKGLYRPELCATPLTGDILEWACQCVKRLLDLPEPPTAIWTCNDVAASAVIVTLKTQGIHIPEQISVIGHDHLPSHNIGLTTFGFRFRELGYHVGQLAAGYLRGELTGTVRISVESEFISGNTAGPAPD
ncbi:MAG TPA: LacI family transcriptional regulator [Firmicutes bacterium]|nr:LacI family transcriptional regulator [Bacillota bacterium]